MKYEKCGHYDGACPCLTCPEHPSEGGECKSCSLAGGEYAVDTETLCYVARAYCEAGREG